MSDPVGEQLTDEDRAKVAARSAASHAPARVRRRGSAKSSSLLRWSVLPDYLQDNEFIKGNYRRVDMPVREAFRSILTVHNETVNIWTHALGFVLFVCLTIYLARAPPAPLAFTASQVEAAWGLVKAQLSNTTERYSSFGALHSLQGNLEAVGHRLQHQAEALLGKSPLWKSDVSDTLASLLHDPVSRWPFYVFLAGTMTCLLLSTICHVTGCCKRHVSQFMWRLDYTGIAILIVTSFYPQTWYTFLCAPLWRNFYLAVTTVMGVATVVVSLLEVFQSNQYRMFRATLFLSLGLWGIIPLAHQWFAYPDIWTVHRALQLDVLMGICYVSGAVIYALRIPERWMPGKFDVFFASHQIFHICVVLGALVHFRAISLLLQWRDASGGCAAPLAGQLTDLGLLDPQDPDVYDRQEVLEQVHQYAAQHFGSR